MSETAAKPTPSSEPATYRSFRRAMAMAGIEVEDYHGRYFYHGPAVRTDEVDGPTLQDVISATKVKVYWDNMGKSDWIVYPSHEFRAPFKRAGQED